MTSPTAALAALRTSTTALLAGLAAEGWTDADLRAPSRCAGWTRGHVLSHLALNADGIASTLAGALRAEIVLRYPDGWSARNAAIDAGAGRPAAQLLAQVRDSAERLDRVLDAVADADGWTLVTEHERLAGEWPRRRWTEVEIHRTDLAGAYTPADWPAEFVAELLPDELAQLPERSAEPLTVRVTEDGSRAPGLVGTQVGAGGVEVSGPDWALLAWLVGRPPTEALTATPPLREWR